MAKVDKDVSEIGIKNLSKGDELYRKGHRDKSHYFYEVIKGIESRLSGRNIVIVLTGSSNIESVSAVLWAVDESDFEDEFYQKVDEE
jgi:hypothetical protein